MTNEFRTLDLECSNLVPQGSRLREHHVGESGLRVVGAIPGQTTVNGLRYLKLSFNYEWSHMWRVRNRFVPIVSSFPRSHILFSRTLAS
jgi:ATP-binding cassette subfamily G (WHITE) protein 2 (SNQ2)